ncbi:hypothetical protein VPH35_047002 [Triticum aestivum]
MFLPGSILAGHHNWSHHHAAAWSPQPWNVGLPQGAARRQPTTMSPALRLLPTAPGMAPQPPHILIPGWAPPRCLGRSMTQPRPHHLEGRPTKDRGTGALAS